MPKAKPSKLHDLLGELGREAERVVAVGDGAAERRLLRALHVDVDPLVVAGDVGERVDVLLRDLVPVAGAELLALGLLELVESGDRRAWGGTIGCAFMAGPLLVADAPHLLYRAFYALPDSITGPDGQPTNALLGSVNVTLQVIEEHAPRAVVMCFGAEAAEYRTDAFPAYHADRPPMPDGLAAQWAKAPGLYEALGWKVLDHSGLEADDLMHSLALAEERAGGKALIFTGDRDMFQCATENVHILHAAGAQRASPRWGRRRCASGTASGPSRCRTSSRCAVTRRRAAGRQGHRRQDGGGHPPAQGRPRARDPRRDPREAVGAARADRAGRRAALVQGDRDAAWRSSSTRSRTARPTGRAAPRPRRSSA